MKIAILITVVMLFVFGMVGLMAFLIIKKKNPSVVKKSFSSANNAQSFLPFEDIKNDVIILGDHRYRAVLECSSTNYVLKMDDEKTQIEVAFQRFLNSLSFPVTFFIQTKKIDNTLRQENLKAVIDNTIRQFPDNEGLKQYANYYYKEMGNLGNKLGNTHQKKLYIIVSYDEAGELSELSEEEKVLHANQELRQRCQMIKNNLDAVGVTSHMLDTTGLIELIYSTTHRDDYSFAEAISENEPFAVMVHGKKDPLGKATDSEMLDFILGSAIMQMQVENLDRTRTGKEILDTLKSFKDSYASVYREEA